MKKRTLKKIKLGKEVISNLDKITGGFKPKGTDVSYCHVGSGNVCCAAK